MLLGQNYFFQLNEKFNFYSQETTNLTTIIKFMSFVLFYIVTSSVICRKKEFYVICGGFILGLFSGCLLKITDYIQLFPIYRFSGPYNDPNAFALASGIAFFLCLLLKSTRKYRLSSFVLMMLSLFFLAMVLLSQSRGGLFALIIAGLYFFIRNKNKLKVFTIVIIACILLLPLFGQRLTAVKDWSEDGGNGRLNIWWTYASQIDKYLLTGVGFQRSSDAISTLAIIGKDLIPHNIFLEVFVEFGILGIVIFIWLICSFWKKLKQPVYERLKPVIIVWLIGVFFIDALVIRETWFIFILLERAVLMDT